MEIQINFEQEKFNEEPTEIDSLLKQQSESIKWSKIQYNLVGDRRPH